MSFSSEALYSRPINSFSNPVTNTTIDPTDADTTFDDFETAFNTVLAKRGVVIETDVVSAATCDIGAAATLKVRITGSTGPITSFGTSINRVRLVKFASTPTLTHNGTSLILPGAANIVAAAGDTAIFFSDASGNWTCYQYERNAGAPVSAANKLSAFAATSSSELAGVISDETGTGALVFQDSPTFTTKITDPIVVGGTGTTSTLTLQSTSGAGGSTDRVDIKAGNNGATTVASFRGDGFIGLGTNSPNYTVTVSATGNSLVQIVNSTTGTTASDGAYFGLTSGTSEFRIAQVENDNIFFITNNNSGTARYWASSGITLGNSLISTDPGANNLLVSGSIASSIPVTKTGTSGSQGASDGSLIINASGTYTLTLQAASSFTGRWLYIKTIANQTVNSASSNVVPVGSSTAGTAILTNTAGKWAILQSDGSNWITMASN